VTNKSVLNKSVANYAGANKTVLNNAAKYKTMACALVIHRQQL